MGIVASRPTSPMVVDPAAPAPTLSEQPYRADLDGLRALCILLVVGYHAGVPGVAGGYVGVDVFFVLSGFLITGVLVAEVRRTGRIDLAEFFALRARRLLPLAGLVLLVTLLFGLWLFSPLERERLAQDATAAALYFANWRFAAQAAAYSDTEVTDSLLVHFWSLSIEEQFYLLWPLAIVVVAAVVVRRRPNWLPGAIGMVIGVIVVVSFGASVVLTDELGPRAYYLTHTRWWELGVGAGLALLAPGLRRVPRLAAELLALLGLTAIVLAAVWFDERTPFPGHAGLMPVLGAALVIAAGTDRTTMVGRISSTRPLPSLGQLSYSWYLWHWPAMGIALLMGRRWQWPLTSGQIVALAVAASLVLAAVTHVLVENPIRYSERLRRHRTRHLALVVAVLAPLLVGRVGLELAGIGESPVVNASAGMRAMSPRQAALDEPSGEWIEECNAELLDSEVVPGCVFGDPSATTTIALVGDSHAQQWLPALDLAGEQEGWRVLAWTKSACPPIDAEVWSYRLERPYEECTRWRRSVLDRLRQAAPLDMVILAGSKGYTGLLLDANRDRVPKQEFAPSGARQPGRPMTRSAKWRLASSGCMTPPGPPLTSRTASRAP